MLDRWTVVDTLEATPQEECAQYRNLLLASMGIDCDTPDLWGVLASHSDDVFAEVGHMFREAIIELRQSPSKSQYLLLFGSEASENDVFVLLFSFDTFVQLARCLNDIKTLGEIDTAHMKELVVACKL